MASRPTFIPTNDKENLVEMKVLLLQQSVNMLNLSLDKMKSVIDSLLKIYKVS